MQMAGQAVDKARKELARQGADLRKRSGRCVAINGPVTRSNGSKEAPCAIATQHSEGPSACETCSKTSWPTKIKRHCAGGANGRRSVSSNPFGTWQGAFK